MSEYYRITIDEQDPSILRIAFREPAQNDVIVADALHAIERLRLTGGRMIKFNGPASLPVAMALAHAVAHRYEVVACYDPKLECYIVAISHAPDLRPGDRIDAKGIV